jgi:hypothetical protein
MMLHLPKCQGCKSDNIFYEPELVQRHNISSSDTDSALLQINEILNPDEALVSKRTESPDKKPIS